MATRDGAKLSEWLKERGWELIPAPQGTRGDPKARDPQTGQEVNLYAAADIHKERHGVGPEFLEGETA